MSQPRLVPWRAIGAATMLALLLAALLAWPTLAADPTATPGALLAGGDPRSEGGGPGLVGSPLGVLLAVVVLGVATALVTVVLARLSRRA